MRLLALRTPGEKHYQEILGFPGALLNPRVIQVDDPVDDFRRKDVVVQPGFLAA
jgi:hypothetical protein